MSSPHWLPLVLLGCLTTLGLSQSPTWEHSGRWQLSLEQDTNVKESPKEAESAGSLRLFADFQAQRPGGRSRAEISLQGAWQSYGRHREEAKLMADVHTTVLWRVAARWELGAQGVLRGKLWLYDRPDHLFSSLLVFAEGRLPAQLGLRGSVAQESMNYAGSTFYDQTGWRGAVQAFRAVSARLVVIVEAGLERSRMDRPALRYEESSKRWWPLPCEQVDRGAHGGVFFQLQALGHWRAGYQYERSRSNSFGYSYVRQRLQVLGATRFSQKVLLRLFGALQRKRYAEVLGPWIPIGLDTEREQSNLLLMDVSRELAQGYRLLLRISWYDNESLIRGRYYQKGLFSLSLERRF